LDLNQANMAHRAGSHPQKQPGKARFPAGSPIAFAQGPAGGGAAAKRKNSAAKARGGLGATYQAAPHPANLFVAYKMAWFLNRRRYSAGIRQSRGYQSQGLKNDHL
jgi:hypothetical protein